MDDQDRGVTTEDRLAEVYDRGLRDGVDALNPTERELYLIQDFILEFEMNGLSGYFYNRLPEFDLIQRTIAAMQQHRLLQLAALLTEAAELFRRYTDPTRPAKWGEILRQYDPGNRLADVSDRIGSLDNYGLNTGIITE